MYRLEHCSAAGSAARCHRGGRREWLCGKIAQLMNPQQIHCVGEAILYVVFVAIVGIVRCLRRVEQIR